MDRTPLKARGTNLACVILASFRSEGTPTRGVSSRCERQAEACMAPKPASMHQAQVVHLAAVQATRMVASHTPLMHHSVGRLVRASIRHVQVAPHGGATNQPGGEPRAVNARLCGETYPSLNTPRASCTS